MTIRMSFFQRILFIIFLSNSFLAFGQNETSLLQKYISSFTSGTAYDQQLLCEKIMWSGLSSPSLFDLIEADLISRSKNVKAKVELNNVAWLMKALGSSGQVKYSETLQSLTLHSQSKIVKYAKEGLNLIPQHAQWNPIISDTTLANANKSEIINRYANMIRSDILELNIYAGKRIFAEQISDTYLYDLLSKKILVGHKGVHKSDKLKIAAYAWMMRASVQTNTETAQKVLETATNKKLKKYAKKYIAAQTR